MKRIATLVCPLVLVLACSSKDGPTYATGGGPASGDSSGDGDVGDGDVSGGDGDTDLTSDIDEVTSDLDGDGICEAQIVHPQRVIPDMLIVLDRSGSMKNEEEGVNRWDPSVSGLNTITASLDDMIRFGLMTFPGPSAGGGGRNNCTAGKLDVPIGLDNAMSIETTLGSMSPEGRTPTAATLEGVLDIVGVASSDPDATVVPSYVLLVTDGSPNCMMDGEDDDEGAVDATVAAIEALAAAGTPTYVLGYDTKADAELSAALDRMAVAGDTGDTAHRAIEDEATLIQEFEDIGRTAVSCDYVLDQAAEKPEYVLVKLDDVPQQLDVDWTLGADGRRVTLRGAACDSLRNGSDHELFVEVQCTVVNLL